MGAPFFIHDQSVLKIIWMVLAMLLGPGLSAGPAAADAGEPISGKSASSPRNGMGRPTPTVPAFFLILSGRLTRRRPSPCASPWLRGNGPGSRSVQEILMPCSVSGARMRPSSISSSPKCPCTLNRPLWCIKKHPFRHGGGCAPWITRGRCGSGDMITTGSSHGIRAAGTIS